jgi:hypothetical protein
MRVSAIRIKTNAARVALVRLKHQIVSKEAIIRNRDDKDGHNGADEHEQDRPWGMTRPFAYHCE